MTERHTRLGCLAAAVVGLAVSGAAATTHYGLLSNPYKPTFCDVSSVISCTRVYTSGAGSVADVPVAVFGAIWFAVTALVAAGSLWGPSSLRANAPIYLRLLVIPAFFVVSLLAFISAAVLKTLCLLCAATYVAFLAVCVLSFAAKAAPGGFIARLRVDAGSILHSPASVTAASGVLVIAIAAVWLFRAEAANARSSAALPLTDEQRDDFEQWVARQPLVQLENAASGAAAESVQILKFNDYQCPACADAHRSYKDVLQSFEERHPGRIRLTTVDFPLDAECNEYVSGNGKHPSACEAAIAVRLARANGRSTAMEEWLFSNQATLSPESVREAAGSIGGVHGFQSAYEAELESVRQDVERGRAAGVHSTPTFVVGGRRIEGTLPPRYFRALLDYVAADGNAQKVSALEAR